jgi:hypothetical protein
MGFLGTFIFINKISQEKKNSTLKIEKLSDFGCLQSPKVNKNTIYIYI